MKSPGGPRPNNPKPKAAGKPSFFGKKRQTLLFGSNGKQPASVFCCIFLPKNT